MENGARSFSLQPFSSAKHLTDNSAMSIGIFLSRMLRSSPARFALQSDSSRLG